MSNRLNEELSPYLLQHADNPVDWRPWGAEALEAARDQQKPVFLSIGYSTCHWCHVMERESFEDPEIARLLNDDFISIKVDREERPDLDQIYMEAVQLMTGHGGWPMSVFLTPDQKPFLGGTYWPARSRGGMAGFDQVLRAVAEAWADRRDELSEQADRVTELLHANRFGGTEEPAETLSDRALTAAETVLERTFDDEHGGFGPAPKFPHAMDLRFLLRRWRHTQRAVLLEMATTTLDRMAAGGIYDQLGGGFHRYSVDARWRIPHFEKMLYDNALLALCYTEAFQLTDKEDYAQVARETLGYVLREMTDPAGGFYSAEDADSEGEEGKFYAWTPAEVREALGPQPAKAFCCFYGVNEVGDFEGRNVLYRARSLAQCADMLQRDSVALEAELQHSRRQLFAARDQRVHPGRDDKIITAWNGLVIDAMAHAGTVLDEPRLVDAAATGADFVLQRLRSRDGRLLHYWRHGLARGNAFLDDYASVINALATLHIVSGQQRWLDEAIELADAMLLRFFDSEHGGFFYTAYDHEPLVVRKKDVLDSSIPSGNGLAATALLRLGRLSDDQRYLSAAEGTLRGCVRLMEQMPTVTGQLLMALEMYLHRPAPTAV